MTKHRKAKRHKLKKLGYLAPGYVKKPWWDCRYDGYNTRAKLKRALLREIEEAT